MAASAVAQDFVLSASRYTIGKPCPTFGGWRRSTVDLDWRLSTPSACKISHHFVVEVRTCAARFRESAPDRCGRRSLLDRLRHRAPDRRRSTECPSRVVRHVGGAGAHRRQNRGVVQPRECRLDTLKTSESSRALGVPGRISRGIHSARTAGSLMTFRSSPMNASGSCLDIRRTSSVAFASDGITLTR